MRNIDGVPGFAAWTYAPSFRWGIGVQVGLDEAMELIAQQRHAMLILLASILIPAALIALFVARSISRPITQAVHAAEQVAAGDLSIRLDSHGDDETGKLLQALGRMVDYLNSLVGQVQRSTIELISITNTLAAMTRAQGDEATSLGATTSEIAAAAKEISATSEELVNTMTDATEGAATTTVLATNGQVGLNEMEQAMRHLAEATHSISGKLGAISDKANNINSVTTTIAKIADQTNLLSLNASIEAEKAGEYGLASPCWRGKSAVWPIRPPWPPWTSSRW
ncbi:methyl-accepting chemotaxis protein [Methylogaea oryzae]|uniref:methyl-accepting chemotaxis protein n=1 Tax=Methylogaea oryzae TaxID=1295382 RepID=UPI0006CFA42B|nr:methyl-accepting chemotaxis protein [Methylogaea oryzae]